MTNFVVTLKDEEVLPGNIILNDLCSSGSEDIKVIFEIRSDLLRLNIIDIEQAENTKIVGSGCEQAARIQVMWKPIRSFLCVVLN